MGSPCLRVVRLPINAIDVCCIWMVTVVADFILHIQQNHNDGCNSNCKSDYINDSIYPVFEEVSKRDK